MSIAPDTFPRCNLNEDLMAAVVDHLARGDSWDDAAQAIEWDVADLKRACRNDPGYNAAYEYAAREVAREDEARIRRELRKGLDNPDREKAQKAAEFFSRHLAGERRDLTRLELERMRGESRLAKEHAKNAKKDDEPQMTPEQQQQGRDAFDRAQGRYAEQASDEKHLVFLWKGCHKIGDTLPDETDVPLYLVRDISVKGRALFWAVTTSPPTDLETGPFLSPPGIAV